VDRGSWVDSVFLRVLCVLRGSAFILALLGVLGVLAANLLRFSARLMRPLNGGAAADRAGLREW